MEDSRNQDDLAQQRLGKVLAAVNRLPEGQRMTVFQLAEGLLTAVGGFDELGRLALALAWADMAANGVPAPEQPRIVLADSTGRIVQ